MSFDDTDRGAPTVPEAVDVHRRLLGHFDDILAGRLDAALALIDLEVVDHRGGRDGDHVGLAAWRDKWLRMSEPGQGLRDVSVVVDQNVAVGDTSANRYTMRALDVTTGRRYDVLGLDMIRVRDGKVVEHWALMDMDAVRAQLGEALGT